MTDPVQQQRLPAPWNWYKMQSQHSLFSLISQSIQRYPTVSFPFVALSVTTSGGTSQCAPLEALQQQPPSSSEAQQHPSPTIKPPQHQQVLGLRQQKKQPVRHTPDVANVAFASIAPMAAVVAVAALVGSAGVAGAALVAAFVVAAEVAHVEAGVSVAGVVVLGAPVDVESAEAVVELEGVASVASGMAGLVALACTVAAAVVEAVGGTIGPLRREGMVHFLVVSRDMGCDQGWDNGLRSRMAAMEVAPWGLLVGLSYSSTIFIAQSRTRFPIPQRLNFLATASRCGCLHAADLTPFLPRCRSPLRVCPSHFGHCALSSNPCTQPYLFPSLPGMSVTAYRQSHDTCGSGCGCGGGCSCGCGGGRGCGWLGTPLISSPHLIMTSRLNPGCALGKQIP